jgi:hypothetical protein
MALVFERERKQTRKSERKTRKKEGNKKEENIYKQRK